ncbi:hypothetical protein MBVG596_0371 [Mycoplasmopsis bovigenitalium]|uniref:hypothetical protein n=1 Tax=Mycoplasmopsis bovigenitalium TaxID=2112 RepID=UPI00090CA30B|nr:hypothetical protein [Mycoplasmopsis bovigenitalium]BAW18182.1 hypothetical protein MBVG596_0371 [Mycoplasmopsis bovigenitalium]
MRIKDFSGNLQLIIDGDNQWAFSKDIEFNYHATNFSRVVLHNVIHKEILESGLHFSTHPYMSKLDTLALATLTSNGKAIFTGLINSQGRYSLNPKAIKDRSIELVDIRLWLSKKTPPDLTFEDVNPSDALDAIIETMQEPKIKRGKVSFSDNTPISAYDTTNKSPYSLLKDVLAVQTKSFLYFNQDQNGNLLINYASEFDFLNREVPVLNYDNWSEFQLLDIKLEENTDGYFNKLRVASDNVLSTYEINEKVSATNEMKSIWVSQPIGKIASNGSEAKSYYIKNNNTEKTELLEIATKEEYTKGKKCHLYFNEGERELVFNNVWDWDNTTLNIFYHSLNKGGVTVENASEISRIRELNTFNGDVFKFEQFNDLADYGDLFNKAKNYLNINSRPRKELKIITTKPFLEIGDFVELAFNDFKFDGRYVCYGFNVKFSANVNSLHITYDLRNSFNSDTLVNFYDDDGYRKNPLLLRTRNKTLYKFKDYVVNDGNLHYLYNFKNLKTIKNTQILEKTKVIKRI